MVLIFGECHQNSRNAAALYAERYPERYHPPHNYLRINYFKTSDRHKHGNFEDINKL